MFLNVRRTQPSVIRCRYGRYAREVNDVDVDQMLPSVSCCSVSTASSFTGISSKLVETVTSVVHINRVTNTS